MANKYPFEWEAEFDDGSKIDQFGYAGKERMFKEVEDKKSSLRMFKIRTQEGETYKAHLVWGILNRNGHKIVNLVRMVNANLSHKISLCSEKLKQHRIS